MISTTQRYVLLAAAGLFLYSALICLGLLAGIIRSEATALSLALLCFIPCLWYTNAYLESNGTPHAWGLVVSAAGWGALSLAFLAPAGWQFPGSLLAAALIAAGGVGGLLALRRLRESGGLPSLRRPGRD